MLHVLVRYEEEVFAIDAAGVRCVLPFAALTRMPSDLPALAGILNYQGRAVPVLDFSRLVGSRDSAVVSTTRILLCTAEIATNAVLLGLLAEDVTSTARIEEFHTPGIRPDGRDWLGPVADIDGVLVQRICTEHILPPDILSALLRDAETALAT